MNIQQFVCELISQSYLNRQVLARLKRVWAKKYGIMVKNTDLLQEYRLLLKNKQIKSNQNLETLLRLRHVRSLSGIVPVAVMTKPYPCPGNCVYCPTQKNMPKSYLDDEPAAMRAKALHFDPYLQVHKRLEQLKLTGHSTDKVELIVLGGTFSALPKNYQLWFITNCFAACNQVKNRSYQPSASRMTLIKEQNINETAKQRIVGLTLETRPDLINKKEVSWMRLLGCTRVEIGVQSLDDQVLQLVNRGHTVKETIRATKLLKEAGIKVCYHLMPNLPGSTLKRDLQMFVNVFTDERFKPDMVKIYPCVVVKQASLYNWYKKGKYKPYKDKDLISLIIKIKQLVPEWVRINRLGRDIPAKNIMTGNLMSNIRQVVKEKMNSQKINCQCIRCREIRSQLKMKNVKLKILKYNASQGKEFFLQYVDNKNQLYAILRLRINADKNAIIRELHTYGLSLPINHLTIKPLSHSAIQHEGLGKKLLNEAEKIVQKLKIKKLSVIAGIGAREYYRNLGYHLEETYMVKKFA